MAWWKTGCSRRRYSKTSWGGPTTYWSGSKMSMVSRSVISKALRHRADDLGILQGGDLGFGHPKLAQDLAVVLADGGRRQLQPAFDAGHAERQAGDGMASHRR